MIEELCGINSDRARELREDEPISGPCSVITASDLLRGRDGNTPKASRDTRDVIAIYFPNKLGLSYYFGHEFGPEGWGRIIGTLGDDYTNVIQGWVELHSEFEKALFKHCTCKTLGVLRYIRSNAEGCIAKVARKAKSKRTSPTLTVLFALVGDMVSLTDDVWDAVVHDDAVADILKMIMYYWKRAKEVTITYDFLKKIIIGSHGNAKALKLLWVRFRAQFEAILATTDLGKIAAVVGAKRKSRALDFLWTTVDSVGEDRAYEKKPFSLQQNPYQDIALAYRRAYTLHIPSVMEVLSDGIDLNIPIEDNNTILLRAARKSKEDVVEMLLRVGKGRVDLWGRDSYVWTPLRYALRLQCPGICKLLLDHGADPAPSIDNLWWAIECLQGIDL